VPACLCRAFAGSDFRFTNATDRCSYNNATFPADWNHLTTDEKDLG
jgi:hypothetical protein